MNILQAIQFLDQICAKAPVERAVHAQAQNAIEIIRRFVNENSAKAKGQPDTAEAKK